MTITYTVKYSDGSSILVTEDLNYFLNKYFAGYNNWTHMEDIYISAGE